MPASKDNEYRWTDAVKRWDELVEEVQAAGAAGWKLLFKYTLEQPDAWSLRCDSSRPDAVISFAYQGRHVGYVAGTEGSLDWAVFESLYIERTGRPPVHIPPWAVTIDAAVGPY